MDGMKIVLIGDEIHVTLSKDEVKKILSDKYGVSVDRIEVSDAKMSFKLQKNEE